MSKKTPPNDSGFGELEDDFFNSGIGGWGETSDEAEKQKRVEEERRRSEERLARWILPGLGDDPALATLPDGRPVWQVVAEVWARNLDLASAAADGLADGEALEAAVEYFRRRGDGMIGVLSRSVPAAALPTPPALPDYDSLPPALRATSLPPRFQSPPVRTP